MTDHLHALQPGQPLGNGDYRVDRVVGAGGFGITYRAWDTHLDKAVAVKEYLPNEFAVRTDATTVRPKSTADADTYQWGLESFLNEARALARFNNPHINKVHRFFQENGTAYMVLEYVEGETLSALLNREGRLDPARLRRLLDELLDGLEEVHGGGYVHRDIKPGNIMLRPDGGAVLLDFGAARLAIGQRSKILTAVLTPGYAPIEQYEQNQTAADVGPWTDLYALGVVAYRCLSGIPEDQLTDAVARSKLLRKGGADMTPATAVGRGRYEGALLAAVDWAMRVHEEDRPQSVAALRAALAGRETEGAKEGSRRRLWTGHEGTTASEETEDAKDKQVSKREWRNLAAPLVAAAVGLAAAFVLSWPLLAEWGHWMQVQCDTADSVQSHLHRYPDGGHREQAQACLAAIREREAKGGCADWNTKGFFEGASVEQTEACIGTGADLKARGKFFGDTPLHHAAGDNDNPAVVDALIKAGADLKARNIVGQTPLHEAARFNDNPAVLVALLKAGADLMAKQNGGLTPLHEAASRNKNPAVVTALIKAGADPKAKANDGDTPLHHAAGDNDNPAVVDALIKAGAEPMARNDDGDTPLHSAAAFNDNPAMVAALLEAGADLKARSEDGSTPLHRAAWNNDNPAVLTALLEAGADLKARNEDGSTPLHLAASSNYNPAVLTALLEAGADPKAKNIEGKTPLDNAKENENLRNTDAYWQLGGAQYE